MSVAACIGLLLARGLACSGRLSRFGRLPGDIRYARKGVRVLAPLTPMVILSLVFRCAALPAGLFLLIRTDQRQQMTEILALTLITCSNSLIKCGCSSGGLRPSRRT